MLARVHSWLDRRPVAGDSALAALVLVLSFPTLSREGFDPAGVVLSVAMAAALVVRRRAPVAAFAGVMIVCGAQLLWIDYFLVANAAVLIMVYTLVAYVPRRTATAGVGAAVVGALAVAVHFESGEVGDVALAWVLASMHIALAAALGDRRRIKLHERANLAAVAAADERARIAREIHDVVAHSLSVVIAQADGGRYAAETDPAAARAALDTIARTAREAQADMRQALGTIAETPSAPRRPQPGAGDLPSLVDGMRAAGLPVEFTEEGNPRPLPAAAGMSVYRVVQEALTNVLRHGGPGATAAVSLNWERDAVAVTVTDDGAGATATDDGHGRGLAGMRARVVPRGGTLEVGPRPGGGWEVHAVIPTETATAPASAHK